MPKGRRPPADWRERLGSLRNISPLLKMVGNQLAADGGGHRDALRQGASACGNAWVSKLIIDAVVTLISSGKPLPTRSGHWSAPSSDWPSPATSSAGVWPSPTASW